VTRGRHPPRAELLGLNGGEAAAAVLPPSDHSGSGTVYHQTTYMSQLTAGIEVDRRSIG